MKKDIVRFSCILGAISAITAFGVGGVYQMTRTTIEQKDQLAFQAALKAIFPDATSFEPFFPADSGAAPATWDGVGVGKAVGPSGILGYLAIGNKQGYSSKLKVLVAANADYSVRQTNILYSAETPGLGERAKEIKSERTLWQAVSEIFSPAPGKQPPSPGADVPEFQKQFAGKTLDKLVVVKGSAGDKIQAITAATVTSKAVTSAVREALDNIIKATSTQPSPLQPTSE
jgi:electron transport complex protein RnfG